MSLRLKLRAPLSTSSPVMLPGGSAVAELERAGTDRCAAGVGIVTGQDRCAGPDLATLPAPLISPRKRDDVASIES